MESEEALERFHKFLSNMKEKNDQLKQEIIKAKISSEIPKLSMNETLNHLRHTNLSLESEIQTLMINEVEYLPNDSSLLLEIANDQSKKTSLMTAHASAYLDDKIEKLKLEKKKYRAMLEEAQYLDTKLDKILETEDEVDHYKNLQERYHNAGILFKELRAELGWYVESRFGPNENNNEELGMEELLKELSIKFLEDANDPYINFDPDKMNIEVVEFLIKCDVISRHPQDHMKICMNNFTR